MTGPDQRSGQDQPGPSRDPERDQAERSLLSDLLERSRLYHTSADYLELLEFVGRLGNFAPFNAMLLQIQKPGLSYAASEYDWRTRFNRTVKARARPLLILWPFGPVAFVYDVQDTEGNALPEDVMETFHATGPMDAAALTKAAGQVETALGIAAHTLFQPKDERTAAGGGATP